MNGLIIQTRYRNSPEAMAARHVAMLGDLPVVFLDTTRENQLLFRPTDAIRDYLPIGSVEFLRLVMAHYGIPEPEPLDYPTALIPFLNRGIRQTRLVDALDDDWVKPIQTKAFESGRAADVRGRNKAPLGDTVWASDPREWTSEHRAYVLGGTVLGTAQYAGDEVHDEKLTRSDLFTIHDMVQAWDDAPIAYALDVGKRGPDGSLDLIEVNDAWGTGRYPAGIGDSQFVFWLKARWDELRDADSNPNKSENS